MQGIIMFWPFSKRGGEGGPGCFNDPNLGIPNARKRIWGPALALGCLPILSYKKHLRFLRHKISTFTDHPSQH